MKLAYRFVIDRNIILVGETNHIMFVRLVHAYGLGTGLKVPHFLITTVS